MGVYSVSLQLDQNKDFPSKQLNTCCKIRSYIQAFNKRLKVDVVLFVNQRYSFWIGRNAPLMDVCFVNLTCHYCNYLLDVFTWYFCVAIEVKMYSVAVNVPQRSFNYILYLLFNYISLCLRFTRCICNCRFYYWKQWTVLRSVYFQANIQE